MDDKSNLLFLVNYTFNEQRSIFASKTDLKRYLIPRLMTCNLRAASIKILVAAIKAPIVETGVQPTVKLVAKKSAEEYNCSKCKQTDCYACLSEDDF